MTYSCTVSPVIILFSTALCKYRRYNHCYHQNFAMPYLKGSAIRKEKISMIESRCGILCSACSFKADGVCSGCVHIQKPFWGDACPVKDCCESRKQEHCGTCDDFPCDLLNQFAYDEHQGDNGLRIEQCRKWKNS